MVQWIWGAVALAGLGPLSIATIARAEAPLQVVYPPEDHQTTAAQIFFIGTAAVDQPVLLNGEPIADRSESGNFAPSRALELGANTFTFTQGPTRGKISRFAAVCNRLAVQQHRL
ncbi:MAG: hypothetical protein AAFW95_12820, partial [Cyanobacteria bacterium J06638_6]